MFFLSENLNLRTVQVLLRCVQSPSYDFPVSVALRSFCERFRDIGHPSGPRAIRLSDADKTKIRSILLSEGIDPGTAPDAWRDLSRANALKLGNNEKFTVAPVKRRRLAIKALRPTLPLSIFSNPIHLPAGCHIDADSTAALPSGHDWIVVVENWESFERIHVAAEQLEFPGQNPAVVWRGDASTTRAGDMLDWLSEQSLPVAAFVDYDPEGLIIARSLPRLAHIVAPPLDALRARLQGNEGLRDRFMAQLPHCAPSLDADVHPLATPIWRVLREAGKALPQEHFAME